jgi:endoglucanase
MRRYRRAAALAVGLALAVAPVSCGADAPTADAAAVAAGEAFLDRYLQPSGRVARTDEGGDTVSEGQAYGMLVAVGLDDEDRFRHIWAWTDEHLQRGDGLLAWRWADGGIVDDQPAADADLLAAAALALAGERFEAPDLLADADLINDAVLETHVADLGSASVLLAGPWALDRRVVNPSYWITPAMSQLWWHGGDDRWAAIAGDARTALDALTASPPHLPPDWATVGADGSGAAPAESPNGDSPRYGYEAARVLVQLAVDCRGEGQRIAARPWDFLEPAVDDGSLAASYSLDGEPLGESEHPLALVAAAASAAAAHEPERARELLDAATELDESHPSYYGAAWVALGRLWLDTDRLGACRPGDPITP